MNNRLISNFKFFSSVFFCYIFEFFKINSFLYVIFNKNFKNFKMILASKYEIYSIFFSKNLYSASNLLFTLFFFKTNHEKCISQSNKNFFGIENEIFFLNFKYKSKFKFLVFNSFFFKISWFFFLIKSKEFISSLEYLYLLTNKFFGRKKLIMLGLLIENAKKFILRKNFNNFESENHFFLKSFKKKKLIETFFKISEKKIYLKGYFKKKKKFWFFFDFFNNFVFLKNLKICKLIKIKFFEKKTKFFEKNNFFFCFRTSILKHYSFFKWKNFLKWNFNNLNNILDEGVITNQFFLNFDYIEGIIKFNYSIKYSDLLSFRFFENENLNTDTILGERKKKIVWIKFILFLNKFFKDFFFVSLSSTFFFSEEYPDNFSIGSKEKKIFLSKKNGIGFFKEYRINEKRQNFVAYKKKKLFQDFGNPTTTGKSNIYFNIK